MNAILKKIQSLPELVLLPAIGLLALSASGFVLWCLSFIIDAFNAGWIGNHHGFAVVVLRILTALLWVGLLSVILGCSYIACLLLGDVIHSYLKRKKKK